MKLGSVSSKLGKFKSVTDRDGSMCYYSRVPSNRIVKVVMQGDGECMAMPIFESKDGEQTVVFHARTIKSLVKFLENKQ